VGNKKHMKTLRIYGDSFAAGELGGKPPGIMGWGKMVGDLLEIPVANKAISGSSTEYSINTFVRDVKDGIVGDNDIVIFVPSSTGRLYFSYQLQTDPSTASKYLHTSEVPKSQEWYWKNKDHIEWWMVNSDTQTHKITFESYIQLLKNFAVSKPQSTVVVIPAYDNGYDKDIFNALPPVNFLRANIFLKTVSSTEVIGSNTNHLDHAWWREFTKFDSRANHLTNTNLTILANLLTESIQTLSIDNITYDKFKTNVIDKITSRDQYLTYVSSGMLPYMNHIENNLK
jgi:hypothetical protein